MRLKSLMLSMAFCIGVSALTGCGSQCQDACNSNWELMKKMAGTTDDNEVREKFLSVQKIAYDHCMAQCQ